MSKRKKLVVFDGHALVHRGFHAIPHLTTKDGSPTNAVYGFTMMMLLALRELKPDYVVVAWDAPGKTFRHDQFSEYKSTRKKAPDELYAQFPLTKDVVAAFSIPLIEVPLYEADDIIGTLAKKYEKSLDVVIVTGDMDELQLVSPGTQVYTMRKGFTDTFLYDEAAVREKYGVTPQEFIVYKALKGDSSDNIPGVAGIGDKGATELVSTYKTLDNMYNNLSEMKPALAKKLEANRENAYLSEELSRIECSVPFEFNLEDSALHGYDKKKVYDLFHKLEFKSLLQKLPNLSLTEEPETQQNLLENEGEKASHEFNRDHLESAKYEVVNTADKLKKLVESLKKAKTVAFDTETTSTDALNADLVGLGFCVEGGISYYIPVGHVVDPFAHQSQAVSALAPAGSSQRSSSTPPLLSSKLPGTSSELDELASVQSGLGLEDTVDKVFHPDQLPLDEVISQIKPILEEKKIGKVGHNIKYDYQIMAKYEVKIAPIVFDTMVAAFLVNPIGRAQSLTELAYNELGISMIEIEELIGKKGKDQLHFGQTDPLKAGQYAAEDADITLRLYEKMEPELRGIGELSKMAASIEWPLIEVLGDMELTGVKLDSEFLGELSKEFEKRINKIQAQIWKFGGGEFNVSSTQQLKVVLFEKLQIDATGLKKIKTGISTAAGELEKLRGKHPIIELLFEYRELTKLKSTYVDALPLLVKPDGRIHTSYNQTIAQTGRLSSTNPNLQNIPVRTEVGRQIRHAFVAEKGKVFVSADYSQIELRLAAELSQDKPMIKAFKEGVDIHTLTAAEMFGIKPSEVTAEQRYAAKAINFGVLYGMNTHGLSVATGFDYAQAKDFIDRYFKLRAGVAEYIKRIKIMAKEEGYTETLFGRRRPCPDVKSNNFIIRSAAERAAVNMPLQGTAADMMKLAMIQIHKKLPENSALILQIHDEVIVECDKKLVAEVSKIMEQEMIGVRKFSVPIEVGLKVGKSWGELE